MARGNALDRPSLASIALCVILSPMIDESLLSKVTSLSPADRLELIGKVWDTLSADDLAVSDAERALLDARLTDMEAHPGDQSPWPEVKARLERLTP
jgi:putative addiction module component (TIGR02574 family)